jgi:undecaprenyl-diphosphatase
MRMHLISAIVLGIIQGLTEFLPISSSGHLVIFQHLLNFNQPGILFDITVHLGTLLAVLIYFRNDVYHLISSIFTWGKRRSQEVRFYQQFLLYLLIATGITGILGFAFKNILESFFSNLLLVGIMLLVTGLILFISDKIKKNERERLTVPASLLIGLAQSIAIIPGISRSGSTIATGIFCGLKRELAARFSFLLSIPAIFGAGILNLKDLSEETITNGVWLPYLLGGIAAAIVGYFSIAILISLITRAKLSYFSYYCWIVGCITITIILL